MRAANGVDLGGVGCLNHSSTGNCRGSQWGTTETQDGGGGEEFSSDEIDDYDESNLIIFGETSKADQQRLFVSLWIHGSRLMIKEHVSLSACCPEKEFLLRFNN